MITHKFREVMAYADEVTVLRRGRTVHTARGRRHRRRPQLAQAMIGESATAAAAAAIAEGHAVARVATDAARAGRAARSTACVAMGDRGTLAVHGLSLAVRRGEILGIAGVSGNGQRELVEALVGQRPRAGRHASRSIGQPYCRPARREPPPQGARLPEEPLRNACVGELSVAENMALRDFDQAPLRRRRPARLAALRRLARTRARVDRRLRRQDARRERADRAASRAATCSARCWRASWPATINVLIAANPVFGLDFAAVPRSTPASSQVRATRRARCCWSAKTSTSCSSCPTASW